MRKIILILVLLWLGAGSLFAQGIAGTWNGALDTGRGTLRITFHISEKNGGYAATMDSPDQMTYGLPMGETVFAAGKLKITARNMGMTYEAALHGDILKGEFRQSGALFQLDMERGASPAAPAEKALKSAPGGLVGSWLGVLEIAGQKLRLIIHIAERNGVYAATMDSPDQGAAGLPISEVTFSDGVVTVKADNLGMIYKGKPDGDVIQGTFSQSGMSVGMDLVKQDPEAAEAPGRPQTPSEPYPYNSADITFFNKEAGINLAGTFTWPKKGKKFPAVVLISGSGPEDRNEEVYGHKPFLVLADHLTRNGIAVLRFDDRGTAKSEGDYRSATIQDFATDAAAAMDYLKTLKEVNHNKIGLLGHSEGGQIAFIVGGSREDVAFIVTLAGPGVKGADLLVEQRRLMGSLQGVPQEAVDSNEELISIMYSVLDKYGPESVGDRIGEMVAEVMAAIPEDYPAPREVVEKAIRRDFPQLASPELVSLSAYDPAADLAVIKVPILALNGDKDYQVPADMNLDGIRARFSGDLTVKKYPRLNHLFQHTEKGLPGEYAQIEETISPEVLRDIASWINTKMN